MGNLSLATYEFKIRLLIEVEDDLGPITFAYFSNSMKMDTMKELLDKFAEIDANRDGLVDINEFAKYLSLPVTSHVKHLFSLYDRVSLQ